MAAGIARPWSLTDLLEGGPGSGVRGSNTLRPLPKPC